MSKRVLVLVLGVLWLAPPATLCTADSSPDASAAQRMGRYSVVWTSPSKDASGAMPIGNGDIADDSGGFVAEIEAAEL